jgi:hypothetical protein
LKTLFSGRDAGRDFCAYSVVQLRRTSFYARQQGSLPWFTQTLVTFRGSNHQQAP